MFLKGAHTGGRKKFNLVSLHIHAQDFFSKKIKKIQFALPKTWNHKSIHGFVDS